MSALSGTILTCPGNGEEDLVKQSTAEVDKAVLRMIADLASEVGFEFPEITSLK